MPVLQAGSIADIVVTTLKELGELRFTDISTPLQKYVAMKRLMKQGKVDFYSAGYGIQWDVMVDYNAGAKFVGLYATDQVDAANVFTQASVDWRHVTWNWALDRREIVMNGSARRIVDLIKSRRYASFIGAVVLFERAFWSIPASTNTTDPYGVPYWVVKNNTTGFNGGAGSGYTTVGGLNPTTYPNWKNYTGQYTNVTDTDLMALWWKAADFTAFEPPVDGHPSFNTGDEYGFFTTYTVYSGAKQLLMSHNDDLGLDNDPMDGKPMFRRVPITWVPQLDADTTDPVYGLNFGEFKTAGLRGEWLKETAIPVKPDQHTVTVQHVDCSLQWLIRDRRRQFVIAKDTTLP